MNHLQLRLETQTAVQEWVEAFMSTHGIPAATMEDALSKTILSVKDKALIEFVQSIRANQQEGSVPVNGDE